MFVNGWKKIIEALSIIGVAVVIILITAVADYIKDSRFVKL